MSIPRDSRLTADSVAARWTHLGPRVNAARTQLLDSTAARDMELYQGHVENFIGTLKVPVGIAGPLRVQGHYARGDFHVPLATTEAALVASYSRGARLISEAGGCRVSILDEAVCRSPVFAFHNLEEAVGFAAWLRTQQPQLQQVASSTSRFARLIAIRPVIEGNHVYVDFEFVTGDAAGQNMVTFATEAIVAHVVRHSAVAPLRYFIESNCSGDKKASAQALRGVRGRRVSAEIELAESLVEQRLHTSVQWMCEYWRMGMIGCALSATVGAQGHYANALAALYLACGQDPACVAESAVGLTRFEALEHGGLYAAVTLPNALVGTVGGGTSLPTQQACLSILGLAGAGHARALAEICAALCLAGELSLVGAICADQFARAHRELARQTRRAVPGGAA